MATGLTEAADLVVEDGTGKSDANSYNDIATVTAYCNLRQDSFTARWAEADEPNRVAALIIATQYLDLRWLWEGAITNVGDDLTLPQKLQWPREFTLDDRSVEIDNDEIPDRISEAISEYAVRALDPTTFDAVLLLPDLETQDAAGRHIIETLNQVGPLKEQTKYSSTKGRTRFPDYGTADRIIRKSGLILASGGSIVA